MKYNQLLVCPLRAVSLPTRECGLKLDIVLYLIFNSSVAPHAGVWIEMLPCEYADCRYPVAPHAGVWIEIKTTQKASRLQIVAPHAGVWIEICISFSKLIWLCVAPLVGVWIEILKKMSIHTISHVAPLVGVWIEIARRVLLTGTYTSLPSWECGLKFNSLSTNIRNMTVAPLVRVWIEIHFLLPYPDYEIGRSPRGSVD